MKTTNSTKETIELAQKFAKKIDAGDILLLEGELGSGKTTFVKGVCEYFGINESEVRSPTFTLMNTYTTLKHQDQAEQIVHIDTYRMDEPQELIDIGMEEHLDDKNSIVLVEWPEKIKNLVKKRNIKKIKFKHLENNRRKIKTT
ncbi:MAG: tRNA (adenosine(37)-N6)-threonylcarbamoyltransferase complex ATPase subunit type 1 TsaE [Candidatus Magasanikbacteria bacterium]